MLVRVSVGLLCLLASALAQSGTTMDPSTEAPTTSEPTTSEPMVGDPLEVRYEGRLATTIRNRHFFCLGASEELPAAESAASANNDVQRQALVWAIFLQFPVLSYLDSQRKQSLFNAIAQIVQLGGADQGDLMMFSEMSFCVFNVTHYSVANYEESVLLNLYFTEDSGIVYDDGSTMPMGISIENFNEAFLNGFSMAGPNLKRSFEGRDAIVVNVSAPAPGMTETELNQHPGLLSVDNFDDDPTRRAVFLNSYPRATTIEEALRDRRAFAFNPNPTNFGLEPGDIVFAVFGSLFLTAVGVMTVLGFCIHPFFLA